MTDEPEFMIRKLPGPDDAPSCGPDPALERIQELTAPAGPITQEHAEKIMEGIAVPAVDGTDRTDTGMLRYNSGKHRMTLIPASLGRYTAAVLEYGAIKYNANNWRKGGSWTSAIDSLQRHLDAFREGEDCDVESALPHLAHIAFNVMILIEFFDKGRGQDDRFRYPDQPPGQQLPVRDLTFNQPPEKKS